MYVALDVREEEAQANDDSITSGLAERWSDRHVFG